MVIRYTVPQFRKDMRKALNEADAGNEVVVTRFGREYKIQPLIEIVTKYERGKDPVVYAAGLSEKTKPLQQDLKNKLCDHGKEKDMCMFYACPFNPNQP